MSRDAGEVNLRKIEFDEELQDFYNWANETFFGHKLPYVRVGWYHHKEMKTCYGMALRIHGARLTHYIVLNPLFKNWCKTAQPTILHEMIHVKLNNTGGHGPRFQ